MNTLPAYYDRQILGFFKHTLWTEKQIARRVGCSVCYVHNTIAANYTKTTKEQRRLLRREVYTVPKKLNYIDAWGYSVSYKPSWFTGRPSSKFVLTHQLVYCQAHGLTEIPEGYCVHHINHDKLDNRPENLELLTHSEHSKHHSSNF